jgi:hypothetical protein
MRCERLSANLKPADRRPSIGQEKSRGDSETAPGFAGGGRTAVRILFQQDSRAGFLAHQQAEKEARDQQEAKAEGEARQRAAST